MVYGVPDRAAYLEKLGTARRSGLTLPEGHRPVYP